jgi:hypothetical protein
MTGDMDGDPHGDDMRRWLDSALSGEPPLSIDRAEILRQGRRKLRNRKLFQAGGAMAGAVVVVVGAVLVGGLVTKNTTVPPAAEQTRSTPLTQDSPTSRTTSPTPSSTLLTASPSTTVKLPRPDTDEAASRLTSVVTQTGVLPSGFVLEPVTGARSPSFSRTRASAYEMRADLYTSDGSGLLWLTVERDYNRPSCEDILASAVRCEVREEYDIPMAIGTEQLSGGEVRMVVRAARPEGCLVTVTASNLTSVELKASQPAKPSSPPLTESTMIKLAALPNLTVG